MTISGTVTGEGLALPGVAVSIEGKSQGTQTDFDGNYSIETAKGEVLLFTYTGFITKKVIVKEKSIIDVDLEINEQALDEVIVVGYGKVKKSEYTASISKVKRRRINRKSSSKTSKALQGQVTGLNIQSAPGSASKVRIRGANSIHCYQCPIPSIPQDNEDYAQIKENGFKNPLQTPLSTFSIDVDAASYSNMRRFLMNGQKPPKDAVRVEEMINYFNYNYTQPTDEHPFSINQELSHCPWNHDNYLLHLGIQGKNIDLDEAPANNLVFLIDVSGSMSDSNKLPLLKKAFKLLVNQMREKDRVAIVVYAGNSGLVLKSTSGDHKEKILSALDNLHAGGSTAGGAGLKLAYKVAKDNFIKKGNNRIILATDGDFNVGASSNSNIEDLIVAHRDQDIFISVTGFGMGNYKDSKMEIIADKGNGNYAYIDNLLEAQKVFVQEFGGTMHTIAKDVKIQVEFNPNHVESYRLVGYENRKLNAEDFDDDKKDAGELGAGHTVTALYEIVPKKSGASATSTLKYQTVAKPAGIYEAELATVKFRYKQPKGKESVLITKAISKNVVPLTETSEDFRFSSAVAAFGMLLRDSEYKGDFKLKNVKSLASTSKSKDEFGYRAEFTRLIDLAEGL